MSNDTVFKVRDMRESDWVWTSKIILFSEFVSATAYKVYSGLCAYASNTNQKAWPGSATLADKLNMDKKTVLVAIKSLEECGAISILKEQGKGNIYTLLPAHNLQKPKEKKKEESPHHRLIKVFDGAIKHFRGISPVWNPRDFSRLKTILKADILEETQIEQLMIYYLAHPGFKKFAPTLSVFFSAGIFNGIMNDMQNGELFYKRLDEWSVDFYHSAKIEKPLNQESQNNNFILEMEKLRNSMLIKK